MTSVTPTSESTSPTIPNVTTPRPPVIPGESNLPVDVQEAWSGRKQRSPVHSVPRKYTNVAKKLSDLHAPLGFEPEGRSCGGASGFQEGDSCGGVAYPDCLKWAESLQSLLNDTEGLNLFQQFLEQEDPDRFHMLEFWLACKGLSRQPPAQAHQLVRVIYAQLFLKAQLGIGEDLRRSITQQIKRDTNEKKLLSPTIFNEACMVVERVMNEVMHPNFLSSDIYLNYVQKMQGSVCNLDTSCEAVGSPREAPAVPEEPDDDELPEPPSSQPLPVVDEDRELSCSSSARSIFTRPPPDSFPARFLRNFGSASRSSPYRRLYNCSYNPVSRQDSELQSLSSDARTDSMSDLSYDEMSSAKETYAYKRQLQRQQRQERQSANMNQNSDLTFNLIPRTSNPHARESAKPWQPEVFAKNLISKLEKLKKERDTEEDMALKLSAMEDLPSEPSTSDLSHQAVVEAATVTQKNEDECQEILDNHVSRVWSDKTPRRSPSIGTPVRPKSPDGRKAWPLHAPLNKITTGRVAHSYAVAGSAKRKDKDVCSLFSSDSGNGTDPAEGVDHRYRSLPKNKSMPESSEQGHVVDYFPGYCQRGASKAWFSSRKTLTDSGVSMVSGGHVENLVIPQSPQYKDRLVSSWLLDSNRVSGSGAPGGRPTCSVISEEKDSIVSSSSKHKARTNVAAGYPHGPSRSKAGMPDRGGVGSSSGVKNVLPGQPFVADPSMPPFPFHSVDTDTQLEETRRRLNEMGPKLNRFSTTMVGSSKTCENAYSGMYPQISPKTEIPPQRPTTLTRSSHKSYAEEPSCTSIVYNFSDEQMPYLLRVPHCPVTLKQFKEYMPKKGRYRYFFVTPCEDLEMQPIQEEITDDCEYLPLWKGKVIAQIRAVD